MSKISKDINGLSDRIEVLENHKQFPPSFGASSETPVSDNKGNRPPTVTSWSNGPNQSAPGPTDPVSAAAEDPQGVFQKIKDSVSKISLNSEFKVPDAKKGIKRQDHTAVEIIGKCGKYSETLMKVISSFQSGDSVDELVNYIFYIAFAQTRYLQERYSSSLIYRML